MKSLIFDSSTIISLSTNDLLWILKSLKDKFNGDFFISNGVREELIDYPLKTKKFRFEALNIINLINNNYLKVYSSKEVDEKKEYLDNLLNHMFKAKDEYITIMQKGEIASLAVAIILDADAYVVDERTTRLVIENPEGLAKILRNKLHTTININKDNMNLFIKEISKIKILRSSELALIAYEDGIFKEFLKPNKYSVNVKNDLISGLLWGLRLRGCSISDEEINEALKIY